MIGVLKLVKRFWEEYFKELNDVFEWIIKEVE